MKRKVCVVVNSRANYARIKHFMLAAQQSKDLELQLIVGASALLYRFGKVVDIMKQDGFTPNAVIHYIVEGENLATQAKSTGMGVIELATSFNNLKPDIVLVVADRFETMSAAIAASYLNIPLAHVQGGEITGNIDEIVRHSITKLSHIHFPSTELSKERIIKMGEEPWRVHNTGCPAMDIVKNTDMRFEKDFFTRNQGTGIVPDLNSAYILMMQHPVTSSFGQGRAQVLETLHALKQRPEQKIVLWPNVDAGSDDVSKGIREFREENRNEKFSYIINFNPEDYARVLANASCAVGNSSSFIREGSFLGTPAVIVGDRQEGREHGKNVVFSGHDRNEILAQVSRQISHGKYEHDPIFGKGDAGKRIADVLKEIPLSIRKRMTY